MLDSSGFVNDYGKIEFSIVMPFYNRTGSVGRAVESVLKQTFAFWELLVVDDGSVDDSVSVINSFIDSRIHLLSQANRGAAAARNLGINHSKGRFICFLDSDDALEPDFLMQIFNKWQSVTDDVGILWTGCIFHRKSGLQNFVYKEIWSPDIQKDPYLTFLNELRIGTNSGISVRRSVFEKIGVFNPELPAAEDTEFFLRLTKDFKYDYVPEYLINIYQTRKDRLSLKFDRIAIAYNRFIPDHLWAINSSKVLRLKFFYKLMWLNFHLGDEKAAQKYFRLVLRDRIFHLNGWLVFFIFKLFRTKIGTKLHVQLSQLTRF